MTLNHVDRVMRIARDISVLADEPLPG